MLPKSRSILSIQTARRLPPSLCHHLTSSNRTLHHLLLPNPWASLQRDLGGNHSQVFHRNQAYGRIANKCQIPLKKGVRIDRYASQDTKNAAIPGNPAHSSLTIVDCFFSPIFSYFCLFVAALRPCQGSEPLKKYMKTWPRDSRSSRRDCSRQHSEHTV